MVLLSHLLVNDSFVFAHIFWGNHIGNPLTSHFKKRRRFPYAEGRAGVEVLREEQAADWALKPVTAMCQPF